MSTGLFFDKLLTAYLSRGMMLYTAILLVLCAVVFFNRKTPKKRRIFCGAVVTYCILYFVVVFVLGFLFSSNHESAPPALVSADSVVYAEVREMQKENAKEVTLYPNENPAHEELVSALASALNAMPPCENEEAYDKNAAIYDIVFEFENGLACNATICENLTHVQPDGLFETTEELIAVCETALTSPDAILDVVSYMKSVSASDFKEPKEYGNVNDLELADALNGAVEHLMSGDDVPSAFADQWSIRWAFLEGDPTGVTNKDLYLRISCGLTENVVQVGVHKGRQGNSAFFEDATLYQLVRHSRDYEEIIDTDAYEQFKSILDKQMDDTFALMSDNPGKFTGYELTRFHKILEFEDGTEGTFVELYNFDYALLTDSPEDVGWAGGMYLDGDLRVQGFNGGGQFAVKYQDEKVVSTAFMGNDFFYDDAFSDEDKDWAQEHILSALLIGEVSGVPLTADQIERANEALASVIRDKQDNIIGVNPISCFFTSLYDDVRELDFEEFLRYCPGDGSQETSAEFEALKSVDVWPFDWVETPEKMPVPIHKYPAKYIDSILNEYAGITTKDLDTSRVAYLEEYDAYYNYTSDFGPGMFTCTRGVIDGDIVTLYNESTSRTTILILKNSGAGYKISSFQSVER